MDAKISFEHQGVLFTNIEEIYILFISVLYFTNVLFHCKILKFSGKVLKVMLVVLVFLSFRNTVVAEGLMKSELLQLN